jgi:hypothetical protein
LLKDTNGCTLPKVIWNYTAQTGNSSDFHPNTELNVLVQQLKL